MFKFYPSNRMEILVSQLGDLLAEPVNTPLSEDVIVVQNQGMHHWLSLELATQRSVIMNTRFPLPANFFWEIIRSVLSEEKVPEVSSFNRDILIWAIYSALGEETFLNNPNCTQPSNYWYDQTLQIGDDLKRYQLAREQADLFEQYLIYRPEWINEWDSRVGGEWQAILWSIITEHLGRHSLHYIEEAVSQLNQQKQVLPKRIIIFGINALPPLWMDFLKAVSRCTDIHFFMLNPSDEFWGDIQSQKAEVRERAKWLSGGGSFSSFMDERVNPLLGNLGQQGQECLNLICERADIEYSRFDRPERDSLLHCIQDDIMRLEYTKGEAVKVDDDSINLVSCHSALRETQVLHDWLLMQLNNDPALTPKDILVMSPQVENYAPYVDAVFKRGRYYQVESSARLPCSIADRKLNDSEPLIQAFLELLKLPDSRFQVSSIISYLRLNAVQQKYGFDISDIDQTIEWLSLASIHWGLDANHKADQTGIEHSSDHYTWEQGLSRLLIGYALGDQETLYKDTNNLEYLSLPNVEGGATEALGKLLNLIENLACYAKQLTAPRTPKQWHRFLLGVIDGLFQSDESEMIGLQSILSSIDSLIENTDLANFDTTIPLSVVSAYLANCFDQPQQGQSFMTGQVTFCSMIPMRSVPFKLIAILGLNDGEFPRQRQPLGFDLLAASPAKLGDRSRRGDDRYLFLEALISAREKLYLSYQGSSIKNNEPREPSLVIRELCNYMDEGYGWDADKQVKQYPMQPFSRSNYQKPLYSFDSSWLGLWSGSEERNNCRFVPKQSENETSTLALEKLVSFFENPSKGFARERLKLNLEPFLPDIPDDSEPFVADALQRYKLQFDLVEGTIKGVSSGEIIHKETLRGRLPDTPKMAEELGEWESQAGRFANTLSENVFGEIETFEVDITLGGEHLTATLPVCGNMLVFWRPANPKGKDFVRMWLHHLVAMYLSGTNGLPIIDKTLGFYRDTKKDQFKQFVLVETANPEAELLKWIEHRKTALETPQLLNAELARNVLVKIRSGKNFSHKDFNAIWRDDFNKRGLSFDPYVQWFWDKPPQWPGTLLPSLVELYGDLFSALEEVNNG